MTHGLELGWTRRRLLATGSAAAVALAAPSYVKAQAAPIKIGVLQPLTGALAFDGQQGLMGSEAAIKGINDAGGIKSLGGAKLEMAQGDARSTPEGGTAEVERLNNEGVVAIVGGFARPIASILASMSERSAPDLPRCDPGRRPL
jgi:branched-chain amino acid transport system substrate-binding protein